MPRYFLHLCEGDHLLEDQDGHIFTDLAAAHLEALAEARDLLAAYVRAGTVLNGQHFDIVNEAGQVLMQVPLRDALIQPN